MSALYLRISFIPSYVFQAPVSLATALQEYIDDPNFEKNRLEYRANRAITNVKVTPKSTTDNARALSSSSDLR